MTKNEQKTTKTEVLKELEEAKEIISKGIDKCYLVVWGMSCAKIDKILKKAMDYIEQEGNNNDCSGSSENL